MRHSITAVFVSLLLAPFAFGGIAPANVRVSTDFGSLSASVNSTINGFGTASAGLTGIGSATATLNGPIVDSVLGLVTISGSGNANSTTGNQAAALDVDFDFFAECDFSYIFTATVTQNDTSSIPSSYGITAGAASSTVFLPLPGTSPIAISGSVMSGSTESFGFLSLISDFGGDGFDLDFTYELELTAIDPDNCDFGHTSAVPEPGSMIVWSLLLGIGCVAARRRK